MAVKNVKRMSFSAKPQLFKQVDAICAQRGCTRSWFLNQAVENYIAECLEDAADYEAAQCKCFVAEREFSRPLVLASALFRYRKGLRKKVQAICGIKTLASRVSVNARALSLPKCP